MQNQELPPNFLATPKKERETCRMPCTVLPVPWHAVGAARFAHAYVNRNEHSITAKRLPFSSRESERKGHSIADHRNIQAH